MERKETLKEPKKKFIINQFGKRVIQNWCLYAQHLTKVQRMKKKKVAVVSKITANDRAKLDEALKKLKKLRAKSEGPRQRTLNRLKSSRTLRTEKNRSPVTKSADDKFVKCKMDYKKDLKGNSDPTKKSQRPVKSKKALKPVIKLPPLKTKPWSPPGPPQRIPKPVVCIPPFKTRPWNPCAVRAKPALKKPVIVYPPLKLRKTPWQAPRLTTKPRTPLRVRLDKTFYPSPASTLGKTWHLFKFITPKLQILRGRTSQYSKKFNFRSNGKQSAFIAVVALVNASMCPMKHWGPNELDEIISYGDINYRKQVNKLRDHAVIKPPEIKLKIYTSRAKIHTEVGARSARGLFDANNTKDLVSHVEQLINEYNCIIFTYCGQSYAIWKQQKAFYIFNSEDTDEGGRLTDKTHGSCCVIRLTESINQVVDYLVSLLRVSKKCYEIYSFKIYEKTTIEQELSKLHQQSKETLADDNNLSVNSDFNAFTSTNDIRSIRAMDEKVIECTMENVPMGICYAVATLCISRSLDPEFYTRDIIDKILVFGNDLITECAEICFQDFDLCGQLACPDEINWNFELNNVYTNIQMDIFQTGIISRQVCPSPNLRHSLEEFFTFYSVGVLVTKLFVVAIWKDLGEFFIFYSCPINEVGKIACIGSVKCDQEPNDYPGLVVFQSVNQLHENIINNIDRDSYCTRYELRICNVTMTDLCEEQSEPSCETHFANMINEELVAPAVAATDNENAIDEDDQKVKEKLENEELVSKLKKGCSPGFIPFVNGGLICGRLSKESRRLNQFTRKFHSGAICVVSIAMSAMKDLNCWCGETIDCVITSGNSLYIESSVANDSKELTMSMLITSLNFGGVEINIKVETFKEILSDNLELTLLSSTLCELFSCYTNGYFCRGLECWALLKRGDAFFVFDPLGIEVKEKKCVEQRAVLYKFETIELMAEQLMTSLENIFGSECDEKCEVGAIIICSPMSCVEEMQKPVEKKCKSKKKTRKPRKTAEVKISFNPNMMTLKDFEPICKESEHNTDECIVIDDFCAN